MIRIKSMKKKLLLAAAILGLSVVSYAQEDAKGPILTFEETDYNFGFFDQEHAKQSHYFKFTNTGDAPLVISDATATCNCTVPEYPKHEIAPGATDSIKVSYDGSTKRPGVFRKVITVSYNGKTISEAFARVTITGEMVDKDVAEQIKELDAEYKKE